MFGYAEFDLRWFGACFVPVLFLTDRVCGSYGYSHPQGARHVRVTGDPATESGLKG